MPQYLNSFIKFSLNNWYSNEMQLKEKKPIIIHDIYRSRLSKPIVN